MKISIYKLIYCISIVIDHISRNLHLHHQRVAQIAWLVSREMNLDEKTSSNLFLAGLLHDCGAVSLKERLDELNFDRNDQFLHPHAGHYLLGQFEPFAELAEIIRFHHLSWEESKSYTDIPIAGRILHLADMVVALFNDTRPLIEQKSQIEKIIKKASGKMLNPDAATAFLRLTRNEETWETLFFHPASSNISQKIEQTIIPFSHIEIDQFSMLFCQLIDFKSPYTAYHSTGVGRIAGILGSYMGYNTDVQSQLTLAGRLHDIGKLGLPSEIINKTEALSQEENIEVREHAMNTYRMLSVLSDELGPIVNWAAYHHERLNGSGYPFHLKKKEIPKEARLLCIADIFAAVREERPYREVYNLGRVKRIITKMVKQKLIDKEIAECLIDNIDEIDEERLAIQETTRRQYDSYRNSINLGDR